MINLAAQAGVRYSFINPDKYIDVIIKGFKYDRYIKKIN